MKSIKKQVAQLFGTHKSFAEMETPTGDIIVAESFEPGMPAFLRTPEGDIPLEEGTYELADGSTLVIDAAGMIAEVQMATDKPKDEEMSDDEKYVTKEDFEEFRSEVTEGFDMIVNAIQMSSQKPAPKKEKVEDKEVVAMKAELDSLKKELHKRKPLDVDEPKAPKKEKIEHNRFITKAQSRLQKNIEKYVPEDKRDINLKYLQN